MTFYGSSNSSNYSRGDYGQFDGNITGDGKKAPQMQKVAPFGEPPALQGSSAAPIADLFSLFESTRLRRLTEADAAK